MQDLDEIGDSKATDPDNLSGDDRRPKSHWQVSVAVAAGVRYNLPLQASRVQLTQLSMSALNGSLHACVS